MIIVNASIQHGRMPIQQVMATRGDMVVNILAEIEQLFFQTPRGNKRMCHQHNPILVIQLCNSKA